MDFLKRMFGKETLPQPTEQSLVELELKNKELEFKLLEKQQQINKTNAYYKKKIHHLMTKKGE